MQIIVSKWLALTISIVWLLAAIIPPVIEAYNNRQIASLEAARLCYSQDLRANPECGKWLRKIK